MAHHWTLTAITGLTLISCIGQTPGPTPEVQHAPEPVAAADAYAATTTERIVTYKVLPPGEESPDERVRHDFLFLADEDPNTSVAVGTTRDGYLVGGRQLPLPGHHYQVLPVQFQRNLSFGTVEIVQAIVDAATTVAEAHPGTTTYVGNIGRQEGGDIPWSVSHNNGRDADIAYFSKNPFGWQTMPPDFVHFRKSDRKSREHYGFYDFDIERNATLAHALFTHPDSQVQFMFAARHLSRPMLRELRARGVDDTVIARMDDVLYQPYSAAPHDDHLHLRIMCTERDICGGCQNAGKTRSWMKEYASSQSACVQRFAELASDDPDAHQREAAIQRLGLLGATHKRIVAVNALEDVAPNVRARAARVIPTLEPTKDSVKAIASAYNSEKDDAVRCAYVESLGQIPRIVPRDEETAEVIDRSIRKLMGALDDPGTCLIEGEERPFAVAVAAALERSESALPVRELIELLPHENKAVRVASARALRKLTNQDMGVDWENAAMSDEELRQAYNRWRRWNRKNRKKTREEWLVAGFKDHGIEVASVTQNQDIPGLVNAVGGAPHISYNAQRALMAIADQYPPSLEWSTEDATWYWSRYFKKRQKKYGIRIR